MKPSPAESVSASLVLGACRTLLQSNSPQAINEVLGQVGSAAQVDRVYIFEITRKEGAQGGPVSYASHVYEWSSEAVEPQIDNPELQMIPLREAGYGRWLDELQRSRPIVGAIADFPVEEQPTLAAQGILSLLVLPIFVGGQLWGFVGFDDCTHGRRWTTADVDVLIALTVALGRALVADSADSVNTAIEVYLQIVGRLLQVHSVLFDVNEAQLQQRAQVRLRVVSRSYQYFSGHSLSEQIDARSYLHALTPLFQDVISSDSREPSTRILMDIDSIALDMHHSLDIAIVLGEVITIAGDRVFPGSPNGTLFVSAHRREATVEVTVTAATADGIPIGRGDLLDGPAAALLRDVRDRFNLSVPGDPIDGLLMRLTFPIEG